MSEMTQNPIIQFCGKCEEDRAFDRELRDSTVEIRGERVTAKVPLLVCAVCHDAQPDCTPGRDTMRPFYDVYRAKHKLRNPPDIRRIREKYGLSRETFAAVLGMSPATLYRYESGALQDEVHDNLILSCESPSTMIQFVERRRTILSELQYKRFRAALAELAAQQVRAQLEKLELMWFSQSGDLIHQWFAQQGQLVLFGEKEAPVWQAERGCRAILFFADIMSLDLWGRTITGWFPTSPSHAVARHQISLATTVDIACESLVQARQSEHALTDDQQRLYHALLTWSRRFRDENGLEDGVRQQLLRRLSRRWIAALLHGKHAYHLLSPTLSGPGEDDAELVIRIPTALGRITRSAAHAGEYAI